MLETIQLEDLYVADYIVDHIETTYSKYSNSVKISHKFYSKPKKYIFIKLVNSNNKFKGFLNIYNKKTYSILNLPSNDYELVFKDDDNESIKKASVRNSIYTNFEPLKNYNSRFIKAQMTLKQIKKVSEDINNQIKKEKIKTLKKVA